MQIGQTIIDFQAFQKFFIEYSIYVDENDIVVQDNELTFSFTSTTYDGSVPTSTLHKLEQDLKKIKHVDSVNIDTNKYFIHIDFDINQQ